MPAALYVSVKMPLPLVITVIVCVFILNTPNVNLRATENMHDSP